MKEKVCPDCLNDFMPSHNNQIRCPQCAKERIRQKNIKSAKESQAKKKQTEPTKLTTVDDVQKLADAKGLSYGKVVRLYDL